MDIYSKTPLNTLSRRDLNKIVKLSLLYCGQNIGINKRRKKPLKVSIRKNPHDQYYFGMYYPHINTIHLFHDEMNTLGDFTSTLIHEYTHYLQPIITKYNKLLSVHGYDNHPHEVESYQNEKQHNRKLLNYLRKNIL